MLTTGQDINRQLYEKTPEWLASLGTLLGNTGRRKSSTVDGLETPELSAHVATTLDTTTSTAVDSSRTERGCADASRALVSTTLTHPSTASLPKLTCHANLSSVSNTNKPLPKPPVVLYNSKAQGTLFEVVKDVGKVAYAIKKCPQRYIFEETLKKLNKASDFCEDGAFQLLREGHCRQEASSACVIFEELFGTSCREVMHDQLSSRFVSRASESAMTKAQLSAYTLDIPVASTDVDDGDTIEVPLQPIRLTSRLAA